MASLRDRLNALTRKTHAFAKTTGTWDALVILCLFEHNGLRPHRALREAGEGLPEGRRDRPRTPAMAIGWTDPYLDLGRVLDLQALSIPKGVTTEAFNRSSRVITSAAAVPSRLRTGPWAMIRRPP